MITTAIGGNRYHHNGDFSGDVTIVVSGPATAGVIQVPMADLEELVGLKNLRELTHVIEQLDPTRPVDRELVDLLNRTIRDYRRNQPTDWVAVARDQLKQIKAVQETSEARTAAPDAMSGCDWHEQGGYGFVWSCTRCRAVELARSADVEELPDDLPYGS